MSRVGKLPVSIPKGVTVSLTGGEIVVKGSKGELKEKIASDVTVEVQADEVVVTPKSKSIRARAQWGMSRANIRNMVEGAANGFTRRMEIQGVGYRAAADKKYLSLSLGYSHEIRYAIPEGISITCEKPTSIAVSGADKRLVGQVAAEIRALRKPEPYKGKGIRYENERVRIKEGKKK